MATPTAPRRFWAAACGGAAGVIVGASWTRLGRSLLGAIDDAGFRWPLPLPLALLATLLVVGAFWAPWIPLFLRAGFPWWFVIAGAIPIIGVAVAGSVGVRLANGTGRPREERPPAQRREPTESA